MRAITDCVGDAVARCPVAHLVVVLDEGDEGMSIVVRTRGFDLRPPVLLPEGRIGPIVLKDALEGLFHAGRRAEIDVVARAFAGGPRMKMVVDVVRPLSVHAETTFGDGGHHRGVVQIGLRDEGKRASHLSAHIRNRARQFRENVRGGVISKGVHRIESKAVEVEVDEPLARVLNNKRPHLGTFFGIEIDSGPPRGGMRVCEVGAEFPKVISVGTEVVVNDVDDDGKSTLVRSVDEPRERFGPAVGLMGGEKADAVIAPTALARKRRDRHHFNGVDAEFYKRIQARDR